MKIVDLSNVTDSLVGKNSRKLPDRVREVIKLKNYSNRTEQAYQNWIKQNFQSRRDHHAHVVAETFEAIHGRVDGVGVEGQGVGHHA